MLLVLCLGVLLSETEKEAAKPYMRGKATVYGTYSSMTKLTWKRTHHQVGGTAIHNRRRTDRSEINKQITSKLTTIRNTVRVKRKSNSQNKFLEHKSFKMDKINLT
ncbi:hypothetical protein QE152_g17037 [Popillia japonica]|uniref:Secreted protein n=1 Tax=Popillia japonica TaxID=7064 RepID=A0AAW1L5C7_POPJA